MRVTLTATYTDPSTMRPVRDVFAIPTSVFGIVAYIRPANITEQVYGSSWGGHPCEAKEEVRLRVCCIAKPCTTDHKPYIKHPRGGNPKHSTQNVGHTIKRPKHKTPSTKHLSHNNKHQTPITQQQAPDTKSPNTNFSTANAGTGQLSVPRCICIRLEAEAQYHGRQDHWHRGHQRWHGVWPRLHPHPCQNSLGLGQLHRQVPEPGSNPADRCKPAPVGRPILNPRHHSKDAPFSAGCCPTSACVAVLAILAPVLLCIGALHRHARMFGLHPLKKNNI